MKILLLYPPTPETFWSFKHVLRFVSKRATFPPLGLLTVAALLPSAAWGHKAPGCVPNAGSGSGASSIRAGSVGRNVR